MAKAAVTFISIHIMALTSLYLLVETLSVDEMLVTGALLAMSVWGLMAGLRSTAASPTSRHAERERIACQRRPRSS